MLKNLLTKIKTFFGFPPVEVTPPKPLVQEKPLENEVKDAREKLHNTPKVEKPEIYPTIKDLIAAETPKVEAKVETKVEAKVETKVEAKVEPKPETPKAEAPKEDKPRRRRKPHIRKKARLEEAPKPVVIEEPKLVVIEEPKVEPKEPQAADVKPKKEPKPKKPKAGTCDVPADKAADGSTCGKRAASEKPGGR